MSINNPLEVAEFRVDFFCAAAALLSKRSLDPHDLQALFLHSEDYTYEEIGKVLQCSTSTAERMKSRCSEAFVDSGLLEGYSP